MTKLWTWIGLISGALPGLGVILFRLGTPELLRAPLGVIGAVCGPIGFAVYQLFRVMNNRVISRRALSIRTVSFGVLAIVAFAAYWMIVTQYTVKGSGNSEVVFPLFLVGDGAKQVAAKGGMRNFYEDVGLVGIERMLVTQTFPMNVTYIVLIVLFVLGCVSVPVSISLSSELMGKNSQSKRPAAPQKPKTPKRV